MKDLLFGDVQMTIFFCDFQLDSQNVGTIGIEPLDLGCFGSVGENS